MYVSFICSLRVLTVTMRLVWRFTRARERTKKTQLDQLSLNIKSTTAAILAPAKEVREGSFISFATVSYKWKRTQFISLEHCGCRLLSASAQRYYLSSRTSESSVLLERFWFTKSSSCFFETSKQKGKHGINLQRYKKYISLLLMTFWINKDHEAVRLNFCLSACVTNVCLGFTLSNRNRKK